MKLSSSSFLPFHSHSLMVETCQMCMNDSNEQKERRNERLEREDTEKEWVKRGRIKKERRARVGGEKSKVSCFSTWKVRDELNNNYYWWDDPYFSLFNSLSCLRHTKNGLFSLSVWWLQFNSTLTLESKIKFDGIRWKTWKNRDTLRKNVWTIFM